MKIAHGFQVGIDLTGTYLEFNPHPPVPLVKQSSVFEYLVLQGCSIIATLQ